MLEILHRDEALVAIHKPSGLLVHRSTIDRHETRFAVQLLRDQIGRHVYPVHRLDKGTSGVLLFALERALVAPLGQAFEQQTVTKRYLAIVRGHPPQHGLIDHALSLHPDRIDPGERLTPALQPAQTRFRTLATAELPVAVDRYPSSRYALVALAPLTGRRHQLRRHMKHIAHPIIGDATHGKGRHNRFFAERFGSTRLLLACVGLQLAHPLTGQPLRLLAPPSADFMQVVNALGWADSARASLSIVMDSMHNDESDEHTTPRSTP
ncbi:MAG: pseudouridine synthase [Rhodocyclaceae bacterium]|jgi:tRNA pseudouridine65 synthase|nr:pseudouridine synthase [Rhodocyclaceae bacterium]